MLFRDVLIGGAVTVAVGVSLTLMPGVLRRLTRSQELQRNLAHALAFGACAAGIPFLVYPGVLLGTATAALVVLIIAVERRWLPSVLHGRRQRDYGLVMSAAAVLIIGVVFFEHRQIVVVSLLICGLADPAASVVGRAAGRHRISSWGAERSLEGSLVFAVVAFTIAFIAFALDIGIGAFAVSAALYLAVTTALLELILPSAIDNLLVPLWAALVFFLISEDFGLLPFNVACAVGISLASALLFYRFKWLDRGGAVAAAFVGCMAIGIGGYAWIVPVVIFFASGSLLSRLGRGACGSELRRGLLQVCVSGLFPMLPVLAYAFDRNLIWFVVHVGALSAASADTWGTEVGRYFSANAISLRTFKSVGKGTSGAISGSGTLATLVGGTIVGAGAAVVVPAGQRIPLMLVGLVSGSVGAAIDSLLGAWWQRQYLCSECGMQCDTPEHCGREGQILRGIPGFTNDAVNLSANITGMLIAFICYTRFLRGT